MTTQELVQALRCCRWHAEGCDPTCPMQANKEQCFPYLLRLAAEKLEEQSQVNDDRSDLRARLQINVEDNDQLRKDNDQLAQKVQSLQEQLECVTQSLIDARRLCERSGNAVNVAHNLANQVAKLTTEVEDWKLLCQRTNRAFEKADRKKRMAEHVKKCALEDMQLIRTEYNGECRVCRHLCKHTDGRRCDDCEDRSGCICMDCNDQHDHWKWRGPDASRRQ